MQELEGLELLRLNILSRNPCIIYVNLTIWHDAIALIISFEKCQI